MIFGPSERSPRSELLVRGGREHLFMHSNIYSALSTGQTLCSVLEMKPTDGSSHGLCPHAAFALVGERARGRERAKGRERERDRARERVGERVRGRGKREKKRGRGGGQGRERG